MKKTLFFATAIGILILFSTPSFATVWKDIYHKNELVYLSAGDGIEYHHDITDDGFVPKSDSAAWYQVELHLTDDFLSFSDWKKDLSDNGYLNEEYVSVVTTDWLHVDTLGDPAVFEVDFNIFDPITYSHFTMEGLVELNASGKLGVELSVKSGDIYFVASKFTASDTAPAPVPEPGTIMLMGIGLVGLARVGRRSIRR